MTICSLNIMICMFNIASSFCFALVSIFVLIPFYIEGKSKMEGLSNSKEEWRV